ncbi:MAG TPA: TAXI family TRAP transporter solute-binding subunit [Syntrophorhabdaceae bacterium]|nr:TAXI family TRAP transporter solute-binding subunit [Syntrophorhabdaceae bacterium]
MGRNKVREVPSKVLSGVFLSILAILVFLFWVSYHYVRPFPPKSLTMATGMQGGAFTYFGERYRQILARDNIRLGLRLSSGAVENLRLLQDKSQHVDAGFIQGGIAKSEDTSDLVSLGNLTYTPLWVFYRGSEVLDDLSQLSGKRIAIGPEGSGVRKFALDLLKAANASGPKTVLYEFPYSSNVKAIREGKVDAVMAFGAADNQYVVSLLNTRGVKLMNFVQAETYTRLFPDLAHVILPRGILNPSKRFPASDIHLLSPRVDLIVRKDLHPALVYLLLKASVEIHSGAGWVHKAGEFPALNKQDFAISEQARRFYKSGGSFLYDYLPFWAATFIDRMLLILIPLGVVLIPLLGITPWIYTWRNRSKYYRWYRELRRIERGSVAQTEPEKITDLIRKLDEVEATVSKIRVSIAFYDELFILKEHIHMVRRELLGMRDASAQRSAHPAGEKGRSQEGGGQGSEAPES